MIEGEENNWKLVQTKTFTKWMNNILKKAGYESINDLVMDMSTGIPLINLLKALKIGDVDCNRNPTFRIAKMENVSFAINLIKSKGVQLINIGPEDIVDGNSKLILGLIWTIISRMTTPQDLSSEIMSLKEELLQWVQKVTQPYDNITIKNFSTSWKNGLGFNAIIHRFRPELVEYEKIRSEDGIANCNNAFEIAEKHFGIPKLLDAEDVNDLIIPDEKSIITYVSLFYQYFKSEEKEMERKAFLSMLLKGFTLSVTGQESYGNKAREAREIKNELCSQIEEATIKVNEAVASMQKCKRMRDELRKKYVELSLILNNIQDNQCLFNLKPYSPPQELAIENFDFANVRIPIDALTDVMKPERDDGEIERVKKECSATLMENNKSLQKNKLSELKSNIEKLVLSEEKNMAIMKLFAGCLERKEENLFKFFEFEKYNVWLRDSAMKLFRITDKNRCGYISVEECKKIVGALKLNIKDIPEITGENVNLDELLRIVKCCNSLVIQSSKVERLFKEFEKDGVIKVLEILPSIDVKHLPINEKGELEFSSIKNSFNN